MNGVSELPQSKLWGIQLEVNKLGAGFVGDIRQEHPDPRNMRELQMTDSYGRPFLIETEYRGLENILQVNPKYRPEPVTKDLT